MAQDSNSGAQTACPAPRLAHAVSLAWHGLIKDLFDSYRPERHYMRGPGPKWHAKHAYDAVPASATVH